MSEIDKDAVVIMSPRDYFIAHAPATPWEWFQPAMKPKPTQPPFRAVDNNGNDADVQRLVTMDNWRRDPSWDVTEEFPQFSNWVGQWRDYWLAMGEYEKARKQQRDLQWPAFWADRMLEQRAK